MSRTIVIRNAEQAVSSCQDKRKMRYLLRLSGIPVVSQAEKASGQRIYRVQMFHQHPLSIVKEPLQSPWLLHPLPMEQTADPVAPESDDPEVRLITYLAMRSLYAVGLEIGQVTVVAYSPNRAKVADIHPEWNEQDIDSSRLSDLFQMVEQDQSSEVMLGADPEFALRGSDGSMVLASDFLGKHGTVGCDSTRYREELALNQWPLVELRPNPTQDPEELFYFLYQALQLARRKIGDETVEWLAGGMPFDGYPIGGHIHFSKIVPSFSLLRKLDAYLSLPLVLLEDEGCRKRRPRYGFLGDFREKSYGGFEYRTLPSWLVTPTIARGVLHLAKLVASHHRQLSARPFLQVPMLRAYYFGDKERVTQMVRAMWEELCALPAYQTAGPQLDAFFTCVFSGEIWPADQDIRKAWKLMENRAIMEQ
jgi:hypothetical protein